MKIIKSISNLRDFSQIKSKENIKVKKGLIYRSAALYTISEKDKDSFNNLNIDTIIDLRFKNEQNEHKDYFGNSKLIEVSFMNEEKDFDKEEMLKRLKVANKNDFLETYHFFKEIYVNLYNNKAIKTVLDCLIKHESILFHCSGGKDRTGVTAYIIMSIFGYSRETNFNEYMLTKKYRRKEHYLFLLYCFKNKFTYYGLKSLRLAYSDPYLDLIKLTDNIINTKYSGIEDFLLKEYNISLENIEDIKSYYLKSRA